MPKVTCFVTEINLMQSVPTLDEALPVGGRPLAEYFRTASNGAIDLAIDWSRRDIAVPWPDFGVDDGKLQEALALVMAAGPPTTDSQIGLILANFYSPVGTVYGYMFDLDMLSSQIGARQGCALFLRQIQNATGADEQSFRERVGFVAAHELGHAFNLWHVEALSFMKRPPNDNIADACSFVKDHQDYLKQAAHPDEAHFVLPSADASAFGTRVPGHGFPSGTDDSYFMQRQDTPLKLQIALSHKKFWHFEPVELELELSLSDAKAASITVPEEMDPGYARFEIWITRPDGERHRFRPQRRHCGNPRTMTITHDRPFHRDISIFRQAGGYTFPMVGRYSVEVRLHFFGGEPLVSNAVECEVLAAEPEVTAYRDARAVLASTTATKLLRYRSRLPHRADVAQLRRYAEANPTTASAAAIAYSLGSVFLKTAALTADTGVAGDLRGHGLLLLQSVADHPLLGTHRRQILTDMLSDSRARP
jgi:hypothetical protein